MPVNLIPKDVSSDLAGLSSVLIASCPVCPPMCIAMQKQEPFIEFFKHGIKTAAFEDYIQSIRHSLEQQGVRTGVFSIHTPTPMMCLWTEGQRKRLRKRAKDYEAVLILACDSGTESAKDALKELDCQVIQSLDMDGVINATTTIHFPLTVIMERHDESGRAGQVI
ncbi:MAG: hypothetical protein KJP16_01270 [Gammaproteobacteria bacterium]|nr:hypothetical protein [Gammaproteobacteria bacterium]NNL49419.1 hypothetical protein [Woeseiaceae bacterium]